MKRINHPLRSLHSKINPVYPVHPVKDKKRLRNTGFTLVELTIAMLLGSIFIFGLIQYWITGWKMIEREKSVLALCAEARAIRNIILNGGLSNGAAMAGLRQAATYIRTPNTPAAGYNGIEFNGPSFQMGEDDGGNIRHVFQYCPEAACDYDAEFRTLYSRYVDGDGRHGYVRSIKVTVGDDYVAPTVYYHATVEIELDDFQARKITFQDVTPTDTSYDYFKQKFRFFAYAHIQ